MKCGGPVILLLILAGVLIAGCTQSPLPSITPPAATTVTTASTPVPTVHRPSFTLGDIYLNDPFGYVFQNETPVIERSFIIDNPSWGISLKAIPRDNGSAQDSWFTMDVMNTNTKMTDSFGYGRNYSTEPDQLIPMYNQGPYRITMKGNQVKVWVTVAKRNPS